MMLYAIHKAKNIYTDTASIIDRLSYKGHDSINPI